MLDRFELKLGYADPGLKEYRSKLFNLAKSKHATFRKDDLPTFVKDTPKDDKPKPLVCTYTPAVFGRDEGGS